MVVHRTGDWGTGVTESSVAYLGEHQTYTGFNSHQSFGQWLKFLANLANLTNVLSRNLGKAPMSLRILSQNLFARVPWISDWSFTIVDYEEKKLKHTQKNSKYSTIIFYIRGNRHLLKFFQFNWGWLYY